MPHGSIHIVRGWMDLFNAATESGRCVTRAEVERYFTNDAEMIANNRLTCRGIDAHLRHFEELFEKLKSTTVRPFDIVVDSPDCSAAYYKIDFVDSTGKQGVVFDAAFWNFRDGKIAKMTEVVHFEGVQVDLDNH